MAISVFFGFLTLVLLCPTHGKADGAGEWNWMNTGPSVRYGILALTVDPGGSMYAGSDEGWLFKSTDQGTTWDQLWGSGVPVASPGYIRRIVVDPYRWNEIYVAADAFFHSEDGGMTWSLFRVGSLPSVNGMVFDPRQEGVMYGFSGQLFKSVDHGETWIDISPDDNVYALAISPHNSNLLLAGTGANFAGDNPDTWGNMALFMSGDGGISWVVPNLSSTTARISDIEFDPLRPEVAYAAGWHSHTGERTGVIFKSDDGGSSWVTIFELEGGDIGDLSIDPRTPDILYAGSVRKVHEPGLFRSTDSGATWKKIHAGGPTEIVVDPHDSNTLYVAMRERVEGGVYRFTLRNDKTAVEEVTWGIVKQRSTPLPHQD